MDAHRFDRLSKLFAQRRTRLVAARDAAPATEPAHSPELLFVQTFRAGAITPKSGAGGRYTLSLEAGDGQTIYFSNRPDRIVGAKPTGEFLGQLGFPADNPPNAALVFEAEPGNLDVAVVELFSPVYDVAGGGVTYEVAPLANWQAELGVELQETPTELAAVASSFGAAHLFIDGWIDCPDANIQCQTVTDGQRVVHGAIDGSHFDNFCSHSFHTPVSYPDGTTDVFRRPYCVPCETPGSVLNSEELRNVWLYWGDQCNQQYAACNGNCLPYGYCLSDPLHADYLCSNAFVE